MKKPKMILFDAGKTLIDYAPMDTLRGVKAYMPYLTANPEQLTAEEIDAKVNAVFETFEDCRARHFEVHEQTILRLAFDLLKLRFSVPIDEIERILWEADAVVVPVKGAVNLLDYLNRNSIRTAVISNLDFSGKLLENTLRQVFPQNQFEFVIASSDYGIRKPERYLFEVGIRKSGLKPEEIWYIGDKVQTDACGSRDSGLIPILYKAEENRYDEIPVDITVIKDYDRLIELIEACTL